MSLREFFLGNGIEYFAVLSYSETKKTRPHILRNAPFLPKSVIVYLVPYYTGKAKNLSAYAKSRDYHLAIKEINEKLEKFLKDMYPCNKFAGYGDHSPIDERHAALITGLGISGDNGLIINEKYGSYVFIGDMLSDIDSELLGRNKTVEISRCEGCGKCKTACPTGILRGDGDDCLSAITQRKGTLTEKEASLMKQYNTAWGCDLCQLACPHNENVNETPLEFFKRDNVEELSRKLIENMTDEEFSCRAFSWRGREVLLRNLDILEK